jgi:hypothetical protein
MTKTKAAGFILLTILLCSIFPTMLFVNGQINKTAKENMVTLAEQAENQIQTLITSVYADENATRKIENANLTEQFESNVSLYQADGSTKLTAAQEALKNSDYGLAANLALDALTIFRQVYRSLQGILVTAEVGDSSVSNQGLLDAISRELERTGALREILPADAPEEITALLDNANAMLLDAKTNLSNGNINQAQTQYLKAKENITQVYQYLKTWAEESNTWRLSEYCERLQQQIQERFAYGKNNGVNFTGTLQSQGYQSESQFLQALQNRIQNAQSQLDIQDAIKQCLLLDQMVQEMEQALNQEINRQQQGQNGTGGNDQTGGATGGNSAATGGSGSNGNYTTAGKGKS